MPLAAQGQAVSHWTEAYVGKPYAPGLAGLGPDAYDCSGLVRAVLRERAGIELPMVPDDIDRGDLRVLIRTLRDHGERANWVRVERPVDLAIVELSHGQHPHHVGIWLQIDGGGVLHALEGVGVIFSTRFSLGINGWRMLGFWVPK